MKIRATKAIMECLLEQDVDTIFGYPGGTILNLYDELYNYQDKIHHVLTAHEQGAAHAADGYARATGKIGVCFATSGPGATNLTTGIATAFLDSSPVVFITCNVGEDLLGKDAFQEVDITGIAMPITKATFLVRDAATIPDVMRQAFAVAANGRPGPVLIDFLKNVTAANQLIDYEFIPWRENRTSVSMVRLNGTHALKSPKPNQQDVDKLLEMIREAKRPLLICGGGVVRGRAHQEFKKFAELIDAPVAISVMGGGGFPGDHPLTTGMIGMHGSQASNIACDECDLLIAVGCRFSDRVALAPLGFAKQASIVQIDIDRAEIDKNIKTDHHIIGDAQTVLQMLCEGLTQCEHTDWKERILPMRTPSHAPESDYLTPQQVLEVIRAVAPKDMIVSTDVGQHQMWAIKYLHFSYPGQLLTSGGFGTMGFGLGAAIGAQVGNPDKRVIHITGDGCFRMNCNELCTVEHYNLPIITILFNNGTLGMVRQWQNLIYKKRFSETTLDRGPDFVKLAEAYGLNGYTVTNLAEMEAAFKKALACGKGAVIDCHLDIDEMVRPMVAAGSHITDFLLREAINPDTVDPTTLTSDTGTGTGTVPVKTSAPASRIDQPIPKVKQLYTLCILVDDTPGVLSQVARLFSRKGYNIESIVSGATDRPGITRISIEILGDESMIEQIAAQCRKLLPVRAVEILDEERCIRREIALVKVKADNHAARDEIMQLVNIFRAQIIDVSRDALTLQIFGSGKKSAALIELLEDFGILEIAKTGTIAIERGRSTIYDDNKLLEEYNYGKNVLREGLRS